MTEFIELAAEPREVVGKANRRLGDADVLPAVIYGRDLKSQPLSLPRHDFEQLYTKTSIAATIFAVRVPGRDEPVNAMVKAVQMHPLTGRLQHVDLLAIDMMREISTTVPVQFTGESVGVSEGGVLTHNIFEVEVSALPSDLPEYLVADISELAMGDSLAVEALEAPERVTIVTDPETVVVSVTLPVEEIVEEVEVPEELEPELVGEEAEEGEEPAETAAEEPTAEEQPEE